ncbi:Mediator of RNA polymerase II transcription subunit 15a [Striga hermonthica]|uniref:Mediator of RNA polymerase II transcription subunit 15a n=1 Tax=Striga hermonthica TaxID=68872 RepID=A0A9N7R5A8_STRHE|nr:Mediator of RNA polymerase II transcription subunit 15a [Striga hermonthica]
MAEGKRKSSDNNNIQDWIKELLPDFAPHHMGISGVTNLPFSGLSNYNQQNPAMAAVTLQSNNNSNNNNPSLWQHPQSVILSNPINHRTEGPSMFRRDFSQPNQTSNMGLNLNRSQLQVLPTRPNIYQFSAQPGSYSIDFSQHQQVQASTGFPSTNLMGTYHENFNILQSSDQPLMMRSLGRPNGLMMSERARPELLHVSAFQRPQTPGLCALQEPVLQPELVMNPIIDWIDEAYHKILQMKNSFLADVLELYKRSQNGKNSTNNAENIASCEKVIISTKRIFSFLHMSRSDISRWQKDKFCRMMKDVINYMNQARLSNSFPQNQNQRAPINGFNQTSPSGPSNQPVFDQRAHSIILSPTQPNNSGVLGRSDSATPISPAPEKKQLNEPAVVKRLKSTQNSPRFSQRSSRVSCGSASALKSQKSSLPASPLSSFSSKLSKPAAVSPVSGSSSPALLSPLTPLTPLTPNLKPVDFAKSPLSVDDSCKISANSGDRPLIEEKASRKVISTDEKFSEKSGANNTELAEKKRPRDEEEDGNPVKRLVDAVTSVSHRALNSAIQDMNVIASLTDRIAESFLHGDSISTRILADDIRYSEMQTMEKDQFETTTCQEMITETGFCNTNNVEKRLKKEASDELFEEIQTINQRFMEVKVDIMNIDEVSRTGFDECALVRCSYVPIGPASQQMIHKLNLELIVPPDYPSFSPTVTDKMPSDCGDSEEGKSLWRKAKSNLGLRLRPFSQPISVKQIARAWEISAREVFLEYAVQMGGGSFSSRYGEWY